MSEIKSDLPLIPLRDVVVFPGIVTTLFVGRPKSIEALNVSMSSNKKLVLVSQKNPSLEDPKNSDLYSFASISLFLQNPLVSGVGAKYFPSQKTFATP